MGLEVCDVRGTSYHGASNEGRAISSDRQVKFSPSEPHVFFGSTKSSSAGLKAHAIMMIIAWSLLTPIGLFLARFVKRDNPDHIIMKTAAWFFLHRAAMITAVLVTLISIIVIFVDRGGWSNSAGTHAITGILTFILCLANPIIAFFRPDKTSENRYLFKLGHGFVGYSCFILATTTIFLGMDLVVFDLEFWVTQIFAALIGFIALVSILSEVFNKRLDGTKNLIIFLLFSIVIFIISLVIIINIGRN